METKNEIKTNAEEIGCYVADVVTSIMQGLNFKPTLKATNELKRRTVKHIKEGGLKDAIANFKIVREVLQAMEEVEGIKESEEK